MSAISQDMIKEITKAIVEAVHPLKIILFGSFAKGNAGHESDLDIMIIEEKPFDATRSRRKEIGDIHRHLRKFSVPIDILVYSQYEFIKWSNALNHVIAQAAREGKIIYERT